MSGGSGGGTLPPRNHPPHVHHGLQQLHPADGFRPTSVILTRKSFHLPPIQELRRPELLGRKSFQGKDAAVDAADQQALTGAVIQAHGLDLGQIWLEYIALGGDASEQDIRDYSAGSSGLPPKDRDALAQAVNEHCGDANLPGRAPFTDSLLSQVLPNVRDPYSSK